MTGYGVIIGFILLLLSAVGTAQAADVEKGAKRPSQKAGMQEGKKDHPCDCCQECMSQNSTGAKHRKGTSAKHGCGDCCERCGALMKEDETKKAGTISNEPEIQDKTKQNSCDCCQKCKAAKGTIKSKEDKGPAEPSGCEDCCAECGQPLKSTPEETPPEIIQKNIPPDIQEKQKK